MREPSSETALRPASAPETSALSSERLLAGPMSEQELLHELHAAIRTLVQLYGSQNAVARVLGISSAMLTRASPAWLAAYTAHDRLARPHQRTLAKLARSSHEHVRSVALVLISRRGGSNGAQQESAS